MLSKVDGVWEVVIPCDCNTEKMVIHRFDPEDDYYYMSWYVDSFYTQSLFQIFRERVKMAWKALRKGTYIHQEVLFSQEKIIELRDDLNKIIEIERLRDDLNPPIIAKDEFGPVTEKEIDAAKVVFKAK